MRKIIFFCTERQWLIFYNCLLGISSSCLVGNSLWIIWMLYKGFLFDDSKEEDAQLIWNFVFLTLLGFLLIVAAVLGFTAANKVSVDMLVFYFWVLSDKPSLALPSLLYPHRPSYQQVDLAHGTHHNPVLDAELHVFISTAPDIRCVLLYISKGVPSCTL